MTLRRIYFRSEEEFVECVGKYAAVEDFHFSEVLRDEDGEPVTDSDPKVVREKVEELGYNNPVVILCSSLNMIAMIG